MPYHCVVPGCKGGYASGEQRVNVFPAPKDEETFKLWQRKIPRRDRVLGLKDHLCMKYFTIAKKLKTSHVSNGSLTSPPAKKKFPEDTVEDVFQSLIHPVNIKDFFSEYWEKKPIVIEAKEPKKHVLSWFSKAKALELLQEHDLHFFRDIHFCVCSNGKTTDLNKIGKVTSKKFAELVDKKSATAQIHQVQRFVDDLWFVMERLECLFGSLVGSNVYITPKGSQGLAPHYDDVEVFIFQLEGEKHWRLYKPPVELAREYKANLPDEVIGEPTHEFTLKPGDVLYMPRGTVHQADTPANSTSHSTHITISMYQRHSMGDLIQHALPELVEHGFQNSVDLRRGLPLGFFHLNKNTDLKNILIKCLKNLTNSLESSDVTVPRHMVEDFMRNRLPPYGFDPQVLEESPNDCQPTLTSKVRLTYPKHVSFAMESHNNKLEEADEEEEDDDSEEAMEEPNKSLPSLMVYSSISNLRSNHMMNTHLDEDHEENGSEYSGFIKLKFPPHFKSGIEQLLQTDSFVEVQCLDSLTNEDSLQLATSLWAQHMLTVK